MSLLLLKNRLEKTDNIHLQINEKETLLQASAVIQFVKEGLRL